MSLSFCLGPLVVPGLVSVGVGLPHVFQCCVNDGLADENAQVDHEVGVHRPIQGDSREDCLQFFYKFNAETICVLALIAVTPLYSFHNPPNIHKV